MSRAHNVIVVMTLALLVTGLGRISPAAEQKTAAPKTKRPPLLVTTVEVDEGAIQATADFVGTTYFARVSEVATGIEGLVQAVSFEVGGRVKKGDELVLLDAELLESEIAGARAAYEQNMVDLDYARRDFSRIDSLLKDDSISETDHDSYRAKKLRLEKQAAVLQARHDNLLIAKGKKSIPAPFSGIVIEKHVEIGEWVAKGGIVAEVADDSQIDVWVDVPVAILENLDKGEEVPIRIGGRNITGRYTAFIPRGDIATRTFTAKFSLENPAAIVEGLEALVSLPKGGETTGLLVPRDAIVDRYGKTAVFRVVDSKAVEVPVQVAGYDGLLAVVSGSGLEPGHEIVVRGCKRVEDGMSLQFR